MFPFRTPIPHRKVQKTSGVFRGYTMGTLARNGLTLCYCKLFSLSFCCLSSKLENLVNCFPCFQFCLPFLSFSSSNFSVTMFSKMFLVSFQASFLISFKPSGLGLSHWYLFSRFFSLSIIHSLSFHNSSMSDICCYICLSKWSFNFAGFISDVCWDTLI